MSFEAPYSQAPNQTLEGEGFFISYNPDTKNSHFGGLLTELGNVGQDLLGVDEQFELKDGEETALVKDGTYYILTGDWRIEYEELAPKGFDACYNFYKEQAPEHRNNWSSDVAQEITE